MATTICLEVSVGVDVSPDAFEHWVYSQLNMPGTSPEDSVSAELLELEKDIDVIDEFEGKIEVMRFKPEWAELSVPEEGL